MTKAGDVRNLQVLAQLVLDQRLHALRQAAEQLQRSRDQLSAINAPAAPHDLSPVTVGLVDVTYQRWADIRRAELNATIARQSVAWIEARAEAGQAFGRTRALDGLLRLAGRR